MGGKTSTTTSQVQIPPEVMANYNAVNSMAKEAAANPFQTYSSDPSRFVAQMNPTQMNAMGPLNIDQYKNPYIQDVVKSTMDVVNQQNQQAQAGQLGTAISSGAFGGDRAGIAAANLAQQQQMANAQIASGLYSDAYGQALATAQQQQGFQFGAGTLQQQTDQAGLTALYNQWLQQQAYPFQTAHFLGNIAMGTGALSGSTTTTKQPYSFFKRGGSVRPALADGGIPGPYSAPVGSIPGLAGYIPDPYLPVSDMLTADPAYSDMAQQSAADYANKIAEYGKAIHSTFFADGGTVDPRGYLGSVLDAQEKDRPGLHPAETPASHQSGGLGDILKVAAMFMSRGGYADGGIPDWEERGRSGSPTLMDQATAPGLAAAAEEKRRQEEEWARTVEQMRAISVTPDQLNIPSGLGMDQYKEPFSVPSSGLGMARQYGIRPETPVGSMPEQTYAPDTSQRPMPRPGLAPQSTVRPPVQPAGLIAAAAPAAPATAGTPEAPADQYNLGTPVGFDTSASRAPSNWNTDSAAIKQRESGGDYNAILGFSNRDGGPFQNVDLTNMTVDQAIAFSQPGGAYADYSKGRLGYVATPMGAYQIVGSTIADIKKQMGLTGDELMTPELQDQLARHLYETSGIQPWAESMLAGGGGGSAPAGGLGGADVSRTPVPVGVDPAYAERNALGQIFYNPNTNKLDKNALLAVLGGIGTMASSPSRFLGSAILQGLGGFANTYAGLQQQQADIARSRAETAASLAGTARALPGDVAAWGAMGTPVENADYASMIGFPGAVPNAVPTTPATSSAGFGADVSTPDMIRAFQSGAVGPNGIPYNQDPAFLNGLIARLSPVAGSSPNLAGVLVAAQGALSNVQSTGVSYGATPGSVEVNPSLATAQDTKSKYEADRAAAADFRAAAPEAVNAAGKQIAAVSQMKGVYQKMEPGALAGAGAQTSALLDALDPDNNLGWKSYDLTDPTQYQIALKGTGEIMAARLAGLPGGAPAASIDFLQNITPGPDMQPGAIKKLLAIAEAEAKYNMDLYNSYDPSRDGMDINAYTRRFADNGNTFQRYVDEAYAAMPKFIGEETPVQTGSIAEGTTSVASDGKPIIFRNGKWEYQ